MPAELVPFSLLRATRNASQPYLIFVFSRHHGLAFWTFVNAHSLELVPGDLILKLLLLFISRRLKLELSLSRRLKLEKSLPKGSVNFVFA